MSKWSKPVIAVSILATSVYLAGCNFHTAHEQIDPPVSQTQSNTKQDAAATKSGVKTELYVLDQNGYVVPQTVTLPKSASVAKQALEYLVQGGPGKDVLPTGFQAVIPAGTKVTVNMKDDTMYADFSKEFKNYKAAQEEKILQSITWTLSQFDNVQHVKLSVNGHELSEMPVDGTPIDPSGSSKADGINIDATGVNDITNTHPLTVYYLSQVGDQTPYYVPVTIRVNNSETNDVKAAVDALVKGPNPSSPLLNAFGNDVALLNDPTVKDGKVTLNFNNGILGNFDNKMISQETLDSLVYTITEQTGIKSVALEVNGKASLESEDGKELTKPVTRDADINTGKY